MALVHDDDLTRVARFRENEVGEHLYVSSVYRSLGSQETFQPDTLMACLQKTQPEIRQIRCGKHLSISQPHQPSCGTFIYCLFDDKDTNKNDPRTINVAMFLEEFNTWRESGIS